MKNLPKIYLVLVLIPVILATGCGDEPVVKKSVKKETAKKYQEITLTAEQAAILKVKTDKVVRKLLNYSLVVPATVLPAPTNVAKVSSPISGRIVKIYKNEGDRVKKGEVVCELESLEFADLLADLIKSKSELAFQTNRLERNLQLKEKGISTESRLEEIKADYERSVAALAAAKARLRSVGVPENHIDGFTSGDIKDPVLKIYSPMTGIINEDLIDPGQAVTAYQNLLSVVDLSRVLIRGFVAPEDLKIVATGYRFVVFSRDDPDMKVEGKIANINPSLDEVNKAITVNATVSTRKEWPKPGQMLRMEISTGTEEPVIGIPVEAVIYQGEEAYVFVKKSDKSFVLRPVRIEKTTEKMVILKEGLNEGEEIATSNVFDLKALSQGAEEGE
ncbi:MAG: hypothetical protein HBSAPP04_10110 [Ignavibacteriaceae bacterium]|nr:MAG: hypothetical protein HBSAPP04_10110 [Ignavibacteriaceae bacterium]